MEHLSSSEGQNPEGGESKPESVMEYIERMEREYFEKTGEKRPMVEFGMHWITSGIVSSLPPEEVLIQGIDYHFKSCGTEIRLYALTERGKNSFARGFKKLYDYCMQAIK